MNSIIDQETLDDYKQRIDECNNVEEVLEVLNLCVYFYDVKMFYAEELIDEVLVFANEKYKDIKFLKIKGYKEITIKVEKLEELE